MSANNFISINEVQKRDKKKPGTFYMLTMRDADTGETLGKPEKFDSLRGAIRRANKIQSEEIVEYGLQIGLLEEPNEKDT